MSFSICSCSFYFLVSNLITFSPLSHPITTPPPLASPRCDCPIGYKGKTCEDREYCAVFQCPAAAGRCANLDDGFECLANLTLSGANSSLTFSPRFTRAPDILNDIQITYRSQVRLSEVG